MVFASRVGPGVRSLMTTAVKSSGHDFGGVPGGNLPFDTRSPRKLAIIMGAFLGSGFSIPFLLLRHQLLKN
ncbi:unnamed protein product [Allacma fusca]|uniref:Cytochrome c oxidase subunit 7C, mitochondrial n=1 Tax=Allacma fusca TaxID=39272 RepID=A0A8J2JZD3_9HEXA|nr:unnamed protein product [Allacma fusca]